MNHKIILSELAAEVARTAGTSAQEAENALRELFALLADTLASGENVKIKGFGTFKVQDVNPRRSIDVSTGREIEIAGHRKVIFTPDKAMAEEVNLPFSAFETVVLAEPEQTPAPVEETPTAVEEPPVPDASMEPVNPTEPIEPVLEPTEPISPIEHIEPEPEPEPDSGKGHRFMSGFWTGAAAMLLLIAIAAGVWMLAASDSFPAQKTAKAPAPATMAQPAAADTVSADTAQADTVALPSPAEAPRTEASDIREVYDTISNTRFLTTMAKKHYGNYHLWAYIYDANPGLGHPDRIRPGTRIRIPMPSSLGINPSDPACIDKAKRRGAAIYARYK